jgi:hypothetical protein
MPIATELPFRAKFFGSLHASSLELIRRLVGPRIAASLHGKPCPIQPKLNRGGIAMRPSLIPVSSALLVLGALFVLAGCGDDSSAGNQPIDTTPPATPTGLRISATETSLIVEWDDNSEADLAGYVLEVSVDYGETWEDRTTLLTTSTFEDAYAFRADYRVRSADVTGNESGASTAATYQAGSGGPKDPANQR